MNGTPLPPKIEVVKALLERGSVYVHLDPRAGGVVVPAWFKRQAQLVLQVGFGMAVPIPDLRVDESGMSCTLSFNRSPFFCIVPWRAVFAMVGDDSRGMVWPEDVPPEVAAQSRGQAEAAAKKPAAPRALVAVKSPPEAASPQPVPARAKVASKGRAKARADAGAEPKARKPRSKKSDAGSPALVPPPDAAKAGSRGVLLPMASKKQSSAGEPPPEAAPSPKARPEAVQASPRRAPAPTPAPAPSPTPSSRGADAPTAPAARKPAPGKTKREIPPYLRVVK